MRTAFNCLLAAVGCLAITSCKTPTNPSSPQANTGYVDFYTDASLQLAWEVKRADERTGELRTVFSELKPMAGTTLRLAVVPGNHRFQVSFNNRAIESPELVEVRVENGRVTPVHVTLNRTGTISTSSRSYKAGPSVNSYRHGTKVTTNESDLYKIGAVAESPQTYQPKERMVYFAAGGK